VALGGPCPALIPAVISNASALISNASASPLASRPLAIVLAPVLALVGVLPGGAGAELEESEGDDRSDAALALTIVRMEVCMEWRAAEPPRGRPR